MLKSLTVAVCTTLAAATALASPAPLDWAGLEARLDQEAASGLSGVALVVREGETVLHRAYGDAHAQRGIPNTTQTVFCIGSTPIDFTKAGILLLAQRKKLALTDPVTKFFGEVPPDKTGITIEHLMTGRSGLQNFHERPTDANFDLAWIDRDEAVRRIFEGELLFAPGAGREHSHSAWGLLAAIIEVADGRPYPEFVRAELLEPAGMRSTGFYGEATLDDRLTAAGHGGKQATEINSPKHWGPTSWLVMGSGGMVSNPADLLRWNQFLRSGALLTPEWLERYWSRGQSYLEGGSMHGFVTAYTEGPNSLFIVCTNTLALGERLPQLFEDLGALVAADARPPFTLGVMIGLDERERAVLHEVTPGGAADRAGLREGDVLLRAEGRDLSGDPLAVLDRWLRSGEALEIVAMRDGREVRVRVVPARRTP